MSSTELDASWKKGGHEFFQDVICGESHHAYCRALNKLGEFYA